jgi:hypothetical protein
MGEETDMNEDIRHESKKEGDESSESSYEELDTLFKRICIH